MTDAKLHIVSGKGGVGKTLYAAALASRLAQPQARTLLISFDQTGITHPVFGVKLAYKPHRLTQHLDLSRVDAHQAIAEYFRKNTTFSFFYQGVIANPAVKRFFDALPLFDELFCLGKLLDLVTGTDRIYDHVGFDAPATGHCKILLNVPRVAIRTLLAGPIYDNAIKIQDMLTDPDTSQLTIVTLPEETPVREAQDLHLFAVDLGLKTTTAIVNRCTASNFDDDELHLIARLGDALPSCAPIAEAVALERNIAETQARHIRWLEGSGLDLTTLPELVESGSEKLEAMVACLRERAP